MKITKIIIQIKYKYENLNNKVNISSICAFLFIIIYFSGSTTKFEPFKLAAGVNSTGPCSKSATCGELAKTQKYKNEIIKHVEINK